MRSSEPTVRGSDRLPRFENALVADVMHTGVTSCPAHTDLTTVARIMASGHIHSVVVTDDHGWGLLSDRDLVSAARSGALGETAGHIAATELVTVTPDDTLAAAAVLMVEHDLSHLLIVSSAGREPIGVISTLDLAGAIAWGEA
jgi:CBS domain-containing protein